AGVDVLDLLAHRIEEAAVGEMVPGLVHRLRCGVVAIVLLAERQDQPGADVLRHTLADLQDVEHATDRAPGRMRLRALGERLEGRRLAIRRPRVPHERIVWLDWQAPVDVLLEVPVGRMRLGEERVDARMAGVVEVQQITRSHGGVAPLTDRYLPRPDGATRPGSAPAAAELADPAPPLLRRGLPLTARPFLRGRRAGLLGPRVPMAQHGHVRVPA